MLRCCPLCIDDDPIIGIGISYGWPRGGWQKQVLIRGEHLAYSFILMYTREEGMNTIVYLRLLLVG